MSDLAASRTRASSSLWSYAAVALALAGVAVYALAPVVDDGLYPLSGLLGIAAFALGWKVRRVAQRDGARQWPAIVAMSMGGLLGAVVVVFSVAYGLYHLFT